jgi:hypothetical protein
MFAQSYFGKSKNFRPSILIPVDSDTNIIVVIPCFQEPAILETLHSLQQCTPPGNKAEVILLINEPEDCDRDISGFNLKTKEQIREWVNYQNNNWLTFFPVGPVRLPSKWAGVGLARKTGMDEALFRFDLMNKPDGIIVSLDADTLVDTNYFTAIAEHFKRCPEHIGATIKFSHQLAGLSERETQGILLYEKYLHFYKKALGMTGYPYPLYTIGSAFAVTAEAYLKRGGMTRRKAGEDFYFLQSLVHQGKVGEIITTCVHPSARISTRVPFGTGIVMKKWMEGSDELLYAFNMEAFRDLKQFFSHRQILYNTSQQEYDDFISHLSPALKEFLLKEHFGDECNQLSRNCSHQEVFNNRFFQIFNAFKILKFLNFAHSGYYSKTLLEESCSEL